MIFVPPESEVWKAVFGYPDYEISSHGRIRRVKPGASSNAAVVGKVLKTTGAKQRYARVCLYRDGKPQYLSVHRLVLMTFVGPPPRPSDQGAHNDGNTKNNTLPNLRWALPAENSNDRIIHGTQPKGADHPLTTLTTEQVAAIRELRLLGATVPLISRATRVCRSSVGRIVRGESFK